MKKLFTFFTMLMLAFGITSNAACYIFGEVDGADWQYSGSGVELNETSTSGVYEGDVTINGTFGVITSLSASSWDDLNANYRYGPSSDGTSVTFNATMAMNKGYATAWKIGTAGTYTVTVNFNTNKLTVSDGSGEVVEPEPVAEVWSLVGEHENAGGWSPSAAPEFKMVSDGVYELAFAEINGQFKIIKDKSWGTQYGTNGSKITAGTEYVCKSGADNISFDATYTNHKITWKPATATLLLEPTDEEIVVEEKIWSLTGSFNNWDTTDETTEFTKVSDGVYELKMASLNGEFKIVADHAWAISYGTNGSGVVVGKVYNLSGPSNPGNLTFEGDKSYTDCTLTFNSVDKTLLVEGTEQEAITDFEQVYMVGDMNSWNFATCPDVLTREAEGSKVYTGTVTMTAASGGEYCYWRIYEQLNQIGSWGLEEEAETPSDMTSATLVRLATGALTTLPGKYNVVFNMETGEVTLTKVELKEATEIRTEIFYESFTGSDGKGGNDENGFSGTGIGNGTLTTDNEGWTFNKYYGGLDCARFGNSSGNAAVTTPALGLEGNGVLTFKAAPWGSDGTTLNISISEGTVSPSSVTMVAGEWTEFTVNITGATAASTITFTPAKRWWLDEVKIEKVETVLSAPTLTLYGLEKEDGVYFSTSKEGVTMTSDFPENATAVAFEISLNGEIINTVEATEPKSMTFTETGSYVVNAKAYNDEYYALSTAEFSIEPISTVADLETFITDASAEYVEYTGTATVTYQNGSDLYIQDETSALMVYGEVGKEYKNGDQLTNIVGKYTLYNGLHEMIPYAESFGDATEGTAVEPVEVAVTGVTATDQNRYVILKGVEFTKTSTYQGTVTDAEGNTLAIYSSNYSGEYPESGYYDIVGITSIYNTTVQLKPISFTAVIPTFTAVSVTPATTDVELSEEEWNFHESISEIVLTFAEAVTMAENADLTVYSRFGVPFTPTVTVEEAVVTLSFAEPMESQGLYSLSLAEGTFTYANGAKNAEATYYFAVQPAPVSYDFAAPTAVDPAAGTVESLSTITLTFAENVAILYPYETGHAYIEDANENVYEVAMEYGEMDENWVCYDVKLILSEPITAAGTYTLIVPEGLIGNEVAGNSDFMYGKANATLQYTYTIESQGSDAVAHAVPAGAEGYINYVEGQWAEEFPFTVATGENSTLVFTAELASFPENLSSFEVLEVKEGVETSIATLNAAMIMDELDEVTTYTFTGETEKEFTEGTDISFRFRFTLFDETTIDTITFEYTVGGDTITGIEGVVINGGDIKVVNGSIVAPEGAEIYNINGVRVNGENLASGVYVVKAGNNAVKVLVK